MAEATGRTVRLSDYAAEVARGAVEDDGFATTEAFVEEAVRTWEDRKVDRLIEAMGGAEVVQRLVQEGIDSGVAGPLDVEKIIAEGRRRLSEAAG